MGLPLNKKPFIILHSELVWDYFIVIADTWCQCGTKYIHIKSERAWKGILEGKEQSLAQLLHSHIFFSNGLCLLVVSRGSMAPLREVFLIQHWQQRLCSFFRGGVSGLCKSHEQLWLFQETEHLNGICEQHVTNCLMVT